MKDLQVVLDALQSLAQALPVERSTVKTCYAINNYHRDSVHNSLAIVRQMINQIVNKSTMLMQCPLPQDDPVRRRPDIAKASDVLGWYPKISLEDGLQKTTEYLRSVLQIGNHNSMNH
jgi:nucleoside-diphosphate-sugar epimerase